MAEETQMVLSAADYLDRETVLKHLPFISPDEIDEILEKREKEDIDRYSQQEIEDDETGQSEE
jgi:hypothetical protein